jgi:hypothetical protein
LTPEIANRKPRATNPPIEHHEFESLGSGGTKIRVRVIQYHHPKIGTSEPMLDIREYLENKKNPDGTVYTGWSKTGISLKINDVKKLFNILPDAMDEIDKLLEK